MMMSLLQRLDNFILIRNESGYIEKSAVLYQNIL